MVFICQLHVNVFNKYDNIEMFCLSLQQNKFDLGLMLLSAKFEINAIFLYVIYL